MDERNKQLINAFAGLFIAMQGDDVTMNSAATKDYNLLVYTSMQRSLDQKGKINELLGEELSKRATLFQEYFTLPAAISDELIEEMRKLFPTVPTPANVDTVGNIFKEVKAFCRGEFGAYYFKKRKVTASGTYDDSDLLQEIFEMAVNRRIDENYRKNVHKIVKDWQESHPNPKPTAQELKAKRTEVEILKKGFYDDKRVHWKQFTLPTEMLAFVVLSYPGLAFPSMVVPVGPDAVAAAKTKTGRQAMREGAGGSSGSSSSRAVGGGGGSLHEALTVKSREVSVKEETLAHVKEKHQLDALKQLVVELKELAAEDDTFKPRLRIAREKLLDLLEKASQPPPSTVNVAAGTPIEEQTVSSSSCGRSANESISASQESVVSAFFSSTPHVLSSLARDCTPVLQAELTMSSGSAEVPAAASSDATVDRPAAVADTSRRSNRSKRKRASHYDDEED